MAASARRKSFSKTPAQAQRAKVRLANGQDSGGLTAVHEQHLRLEAAFAGAETQSYPPAVKLAIFVGAPTALWAGLFYLGAQLLRLGATH